jgi:hypothetical protein
MNFRPVVYKILLDSQCDLRLFWFNAIPRSSKPVLGNAPLLLVLLITETVLEKLEGDD